jgi:hypothetical protein
MSEPVTKYRSTVATLAAGAVRAIIEDVERRMAREIVIARGVERVLRIIESDELPAERYRRENVLKP